jgi:predicted nucleic acid-binding protein
MLSELSDVIARDKFTVKRTQVNRFLSDLTSNSKMVPDNPRFKVILQDSDDDVILNTAYTGKAERFELLFKPLSIWLNISVYGPKKKIFS